MRWLDSITNTRTTNLVKLWEMVRERRPSVLQFTGWQEFRHTTERLNNNLIKSLLVKIANYR